APEKLVVRMWLFPVLTVVALAGMAGIFLLMLRQPDTRDQLLATGALTLVLIGVGVVRQRRKGNAEASDGSGASVPAQRK
ncbi:amino acid transporter, partial [Streptomyces sp. NPDC056295]